MENPTQPTPDTDDKRKPSGELVEWVMEKVNRWRGQRDSNKERDWAKFYRIWRGRWDPSLQGKQAERSKIITPASQSAVDQTVAEMMEAVFGRGDWVDLVEEDDTQQALQAPQAATPGTPPGPPPPSPLEVGAMVRDHLIDDLKNAGIKRDLKRIFYNGSIYGTGVAKRLESKRLDGTVYICWDAVRPNDFVIDTAAMTVDDALGVAHETILPLHLVKEKQAAGEYYDDEDIESATGYGTSSVLNKSRMSDMQTIDPQDGVYFTEYHGKVPRKLLVEKPAKDPNNDLLEDPEPEGSDPDDEYDYVEAIVCIGNGTVLLSAHENALKDRGFIAYQHHESPDEFWGIGVVEKAFNAQMALDGEVRARMDALALLTYPTVGVDSTRMPRNMSMSVAPGKVYLTNGPPNEIIQPIVFGQLNNASFQQSGDLERYVQIATGASDPASPVNANSTASGQSQQSSAYIKRSKLTMQAVDEFLNSLVRKTLVAYNAINPQRYPQLPYFTVNSTMSIMAREFEQMQMTNLLAIIPQQSPAFPIVLKGIIGNYSGPQKDKIMAAIDKSMQPDPAAVQAQQAAQKMQMDTAQAALEKTQAERDEVRTRAGLNQSKAKETDAKTQVVPVTAQVQVAQVMQSHKTADNQARQIEVEAAKAHIDHFHRVQEHDHKRVANFISFKKAQQPTAAPQTE